MPVDFWTRFFPVFNTFGAALLPPFNSLINAGPPTLIAVATAGNIHGAKKNASSNCSSVTLSDFVLPSSSKCISLIS